MDYPFKNLVFEGGGVKGIAYGGALDILDSMGILSNIIRVAGTSAGAINATLLALNFSVKEVSDIVAATKFSSFEDAGGGWLGSVRRVLSQFGWFQGDYFKQWISGYIKQKTGNEQTTFAQLKSRQSEGFRELYVVATNLTQQRSDVFSHETSPDLPICDAVRMSMSIPLFFSSVKKPNIATGDNDVMVDGGVAWNYAVNLFDKKKYIANPVSGETVNYNTDPNYIFNHETLGFRLDSKQTIEYSKSDWSIVPEQIKSIKDYASALVSFMMETANNLHLHQNDWNRTIFIDTLDVQTTDFKLPPQKIDQLIESGKKGVTDYFAWRDSAVDPLKGIVPIAAKLKS